MALDDLYIHTYYNIAFVVDYSNFAYKLHLNDTIDYVVYYEYFAINCHVVHLYAMENFFECLIFYYYCHVVENNLQHKYVYEFVYHYNLSNKYLNLHVPHVVEVAVVIIYFNDFRHFFHSIDVILGNVHVSVINFF